MRCFVAVDLSVTARAAVARVQTALRAAAPGADVRWSDPAGFHLTLEFLGELADTRAAAAAAALAPVAAGTAPFELALGRVGAFPDPRRARVLWLGLSAGAEPLAALAAAVAQALGALGFPPEARPFHGHATLGRVRSGRRPGALADALGAAPLPEPAAWTVREVVLYRSHLRPGGAEYAALARLPLGSRDT
jgi:2'-5' RNA ligase